MRRLVILVTFLLPLVACAPQRESRTLEVSVPAAGVSSLLTHANIGVVVVKASPDDEVHVSVKLEPSNNFFWDLFTHSKVPAAIKTATLGHTLDKGVLDFHVQYPPNSDTDDISETWTFAVPARVHVSSHINIGKLKVTGIAGGVEAQLNIGKATLDVPGGALDVSMNVGKIEAQSHTLDYGAVSLATDVGDTHLTVDGMSVGDQQKEGTGSQMHYQGKGTTPITLKANTGKVTLALSPSQPPAPATKP